MEEESRKRAGNTRRRHEPRQWKKRGRYPASGSRNARETARVRGARRYEVGNKRGPNVVVTGDVALPDDISLRNYLSVQRDSARRLPVLMPADNVPIVS